MKQKIVTNSIFKASPFGGGWRGLLLLLTLFALTACSFQEQPLTYFFDRPARIWEEALPLGNGRIGMMADGGVEKENIVLNEISMWSGSRQETDNPEAYLYLSRIRQLLFEGKNDEAQRLMYETFVCKGAGSNLGNGASAPYGSYQLLGNLTFNHYYPEADSPVSDYRRELDLQQAISTVSFRKGETTYTREAFTAFSGDIGVIRLKADKEKILHFAVGMNRPEHATLHIQGQDLIMEGQLPDGKGQEANTGTRFQSRLRILLPKGGTIMPGDSLLTIKGATEAIVLVSMATDYFDRQGWEESLLSLLTEAEQTGYEKLREEHIRKYEELFGRVELDLGSSGRESMPIDQRLKAFVAADKNDPSLATLYFQFGRYLLIGSTRPGLLPPNLQGLWCNTIDTPWNGDYHLNINLQMNLWPAEVTHLPELHEPLIEWTKQQVKSGEKTARAFYRARGWVTHILGNVWEFTAPGEHPSWGATNTSAAWLCAHLYNHYLYNRDTTYLADVYPVMKGAALFFCDMLVADPRTGYLVTAPTTSPENGYLLNDSTTVYVCAGSTMDNQIVRELFSNTIASASVLGIDSAFSRLLEEKRDRLMPTTIGEDGRIMEWLEPFKEAEPTHRHVSHLYGLYPGNEISVDYTPHLAQAARKTLEVRGDQSTGWSMAWKINFWARLYDGDHAYKLLGDLLRPCVDEKTGEVKGGGTYPNLFCSHPPFQIDGNFGGCAGIAEMLVQSQAGSVVILPALPSAWPCGSFKGLKVQGGAEVSARWREGKVQEFKLRATVAGEFSVKLPDHSDKLRVQKENKTKSLPVVDGRITIELQAGEEVSINFY